MTDKCPILMWDFILYSGDSNESGVIYGFLDFVSMEIFEPSIQLSAYRLRLSLQPPITNLRRKTNAVIRDVEFTARGEPGVARLLSIPNAFVLGRKVRWLTNFQFLEKYNLPDGHLIIAVPVKLANLMAVDDESTTFALKILGQVENYKNLGKYVLVQFNVAREVRYTLDGAGTPSPIPFEKSSKVFKSTIVVQGFTASGTMSNSKECYNSLKYRIVSIDSTVSGTFVYYYIVWYYVVSVDIIYVN